MSISASGSISVLRDINRAKLIAALCEFGPLPRTELAAISGVTKTTAGAHVDALAAAGVLEQVPLDPDATGSRGRPAHPVWFRRDAGLCGTLFIRAEQVSAALCNARGEVLESVEADMPADASAPRLARLCEQLVRSVTKDRQLLGIGVALSGAVDFDSQVVLRSARLPMLEGTTFVTTLRARLGNSVLVDNDARAGAMAERWYGMGRQERNFWTVQIGGGIGAGAIADGVLQRGLHGAAGEVGHTTVSVGDLRCACGRFGCWEVVASLDGLRRSAVGRGLTRARSLTFDDLGPLANTQDPVSLALLEEYASHVAMGLLNIINTVAPAALILQGQITSAGSDLLARVRAEVTSLSLDPSVARTRIEYSALGQHPQLLGAAALVIAQAWGIGG